MHGYNNFWMYSLIGIAFSVLLYATYTVQPL